MNSVTANAAQTAPTDNVGESDGKNALPTAGATYSRINRSKKSSDQPRVDAIIAVTEPRLDKATGRATSPTPTIVHSSVCLTGEFRDRLGQSYRSGLRRCDAEDAGAAMATPANIS